MNSQRRSFYKEILRALPPLAILAVGVIAYAAMSSQRKPPEPMAREAKLPLVEAAPVGVSPGGLDLHVDGVVVPHREIILSAEVGGRITQKSAECRAGMFVSRGTVLAEIDPRSYRLELDRLNEEVKQAAALLQELDVDIENARRLLALAKEETALRQRELQRVERLLGQAAASESSVDDVRRLELMARNSEVQLENQLRLKEASRSRLVAGRDLAQAKAEQAQLDLDKSRIVAPIDGVIVTESIEQDSFVQPGTALLTIDDPTAAEVRCSLRMEELEWVWRQAHARTPAPDPTSPTTLPETPVTISYRLGNHEYQWDGLLWRFEGIGLDERTRTVPCRVLVREPRVRRQLPGEGGPVAGPQALVRGMYVQMTIHVQTSQRLLALEERSVQPGNFVWRVRDGKLDRVLLQDVTLSRRRILAAESSEGLSAGDLVVTTPLPVAVDGMAVEVLQRDEESTL